LILKFNDKSSLKPAHDFILKKSQSETVDDLFAVQYYKKIFDNQRERNYADKRLIKKMVRDEFER